MRARTHRHLATLGLILWLAGTAAPSYAVWQWMRGAALSDFRESDWEMLKEAARVVLEEKPDGEQVNWQNAATGNKGSIIGLDTFTHEGRDCRRAAMRNISHRGRDDTAAYSLCRQADGDWIFVPDSLAGTKNQ